MNARIEILRSNTTDILTALVLALFISQLSEAQTSISHDLFPLGNQLHYKYSYERRSQTSEVTLLRYKAIDSGTVEYIMSAPLFTNDSTIFWPAVQVTNLYRFLFDAYQDVDTSYWSTDTITVQLSESTIGSHEIRCSSLVWFFPTSNPSKSIYRFSDSSGATVTSTYSMGSFYTQYDTLEFGEYQGLTRHIATGSGHAITHASYYLLVQLVNLTTRVHEGTNIIPIGPSIDQNFPNPFNSATKVRYRLDSPQPVALIVIDVLGRAVREIDFGEQPPGLHSYEFDARTLASGIYFYRITGIRPSVIRKMVLQK